MSDRRDLRLDHPSDVQPSDVQPSDTGSTLPFGHVPQQRPASSQPAAAQTLSFGQASPDLVATAASIPSRAQPATPNPDLVSTEPDLRSTDPDLVSTAASIPPAADSSASLPPQALVSGRTTVLPRLDAVSSGAPKLVSQLRPRYEPMRVLGKGGMGEVSLELDRDIGRSVAIKRLLPQVAGDLGVARFVDEVRVMGRLEHPNIVPVHDVGLDEQGRYYFVMKHVEGDTLEQIIERLRQGDPDTVRRFSFEARIELFIGILRALQFAHEKGFVHRDVKPANVMVGRYGEVVLMDWGIAKPLGTQPAQGELPPVAGAADLLWAAGESAVDADQMRLSATRMGQVVGTPAYMSPEQAQGLNEKTDQRSDLYSATAVFGELVTLRHYLAGRKTLDEVMQGVLDPKAVRAWVGSSRVPAELGHFIVKGMAQEPEDRFRSAAEMIDGLQAILEGRCVVQCPVTFTKRVTREAGRFVDRHPGAAMGALAAGGCMLLFSAIQMVLMLAG